MKSKKALKFQNSPVDTTKYFLVYFVASFFTKFIKLFYTLTVKTIYNLKLHVSPVVKRGIFKTKMLS